MNLSERRQWRLTSPKSTELAPPLERAEQAVVFDWIAREANRLPILRLVHASANGAKMHKVTASLMVRQGMRAGVPDILAPFARAGYIGLAIEMKRKPNEPTDLQEEWLRMLRVNGWKTLVCYSATEAIEALQSYVSAEPTLFGKAFADASIPF